MIILETRLAFDMNLEFGYKTLDFFYGLRMTKGYQLDHSLSLRLLKHFFDNIFLEHGEVDYPILSYCPFVLST